MQLGKLLRLQLVGRTATALPQRTAQSRQRVEYDEGIRDKQHKQDYGDRHADVDTEGPYQGRHDRLGLYTHNSLRQVWDRVGLSCCKVYEVARERDCPNVCVGHRATVATEVAWHLS